MIDQIHDLLKEQAQELIANNASLIAQELSENQEGKCATALSLKLTKMGPAKVHCGATLSFSRKFKDESEGLADIPDPRQPEFTSIEISSGGQSVVIDQEAAKRIKRIAKTCDAILAKP